jgi:ferric-dicitrate binding protein FerR (iron transport regulator)
MNHFNNDVLLILSRWESGVPLTDEEQATFNAWLTRHRSKIGRGFTEERLAEIAYYQRETEHSLQRFREKHPDAVTIDNRSTVVKIKPPVTLWLLRAAACAVVIILAWGAWYWLTPKETGNQPMIAKEQVHSDVQAGTYRATLTLSDGATLALDENKEGIIPTQQQVIIRQEAKGKLIYRAVQMDTLTKQATTYSMKDHELKTPVKGKYKLILSDGSIITLNADSHLQFPAVFTGPERRVKLSGEGYFEVAHNPSKPFIVQFNKDSIIKVLGTHFNIRSYSDDDSTKVTLLSGKIQMGARQDAPLLYPGCQAVLSNKPGFQITQVTPFAINQAVAWAKDSIYFKNASVREVMRQLSRWYGITVEFKGDVANRNVKLGPVSSHLPLSEVLGLMKGVVRYQINGKNVVLSEDMTSR